MKNISFRHAMIVGAFVVALYVLCLLWRVTITEDEVANFHLLALKTAFPGFGGYDVLSIIWGAVLSFVYGWIGSVLFHSLHASCCAKK